MLAEQGLGCTRKEERTSPLMGEIWEIREIGEEKRMLRRLYASEYRPIKSPQRFFPEYRKNSSGAERLKTFSRIPGAVFREFHGIGTPIAWNSRNILFVLPPPLI
jgi:hypothetical protein